MTDKEFMMNYEQANNTQINIAKIMNDLKDQNNELSREISRLSGCKGTKENPHNHNAEIAAQSAQIDQNNKWINQLSKLHKGIADLKDLAQATDQKLVAYLEKMMNDRNISKDNDDINADKQKINYLQNQIDKKLNKLA